MQYGNWIIVYLIIQLIILKMVINQDLYIFDSSLPTYSGSIAFLPKVFSIILKIKKKLI